MYQVTNYPRDDDDAPCRFPQRQRVAVRVPVPCGKTLWTGWENQTGEGGRSYRVRDEVWVSRQAEKNKRIIQRNRERAEIAYALFEARMKKEIEKRYEWWPKIMSMSYADSFLPPIGFTKQATPYLPKKDYPTPVAKVVQSGVWSGSWVAPYNTTYASSPTAEAITTLRDYVVRTIRAVELSL